MARLIGNYMIPGQEPDPEPAPAEQPSDAVAEFERRAMARLGGSIAFVMKGKQVVWTGEPAAKRPDEEST